MPSSAGVPSAMHYPTNVRTSPNSVTEEPYTSPAAITSPSDSIPNLLRLLSFHPLQHLRHVATICKRIPAITCLESPIDNLVCVWVKDVYEFPFTGCTE